MEPMIITRLYLKNFLPIRSVHHKDEIDLRFPKDKMINLFYGDMGTCKTFILGHLQPWHNFGTLDARNQDKMIAENEDGVKIIEYEKGNDYYIIRHDYISGGKTTKHYVQKNGEELNENGNLKTFNMIIENEFGIEPDMLKLIRIGANVTNILDLNSVERKKLVASLRKETDWYVMCHKKLTQDYRVLNAQLSGLSQRLSQLSYEKAEQYEDAYTDIGIEIDDKSKAINSLICEKSQLEGEISAKLGGMKLEDFIIEFRRIEKEKDTIEVSIKEMESELNELSTLPPVEEISKKLGALDQTLQTLRDSTVFTENEYTQKSVELEKLKDIKRVSQNTEQLQILKKTYQDLYEKSMSYQGQLSGFNVDMTAAQLIQIDGELAEMQSLLDTLHTYRSEDVSKVFYSDSSIIGFAKKKIDILSATKIKKQKDVNNMKYSAEYSPTENLFRPPFCPSKDCPYYKSHPVTIRKDGESTSIQSEILNRIAEVDQLDVEIYRYSDYSIIYQKCEQIKTLWKSMEKKISKLGILNVNKLDLIVNDGKYSNWYNGSRVVELIDLANKRDEMYSLNQRLVSVKDEISQIELNSDVTIDDKIIALESETRHCLDILRENEKKTKDTMTEIASYNEIYLKISEASAKKSKYSDLMQSYHDVCDKLAQMSKYKCDAEQAIDRIQILNQKLLVLQSEFEKLKKEHDDIGFRLRDIKRTKQEYGDLLEEKEIWTDILEAVSPKSGIPLIAIQMYLNDAKDDINDLIAEVDDDFEISRFEINDDEFQIPYIANGQLINDVSKASQGEKSIVNIAIPFALIQHSGIEYNIMLLDEVDAALHTSQRNAYPSIIMRQMKKINSRQVFIISHNWAYDGYPINMILTSEENLSPSPLRSITKL